MKGALKVRADFQFELSLPTGQTVKFSMGRVLAQQLGDTLLSFATARKASDGRGQLTFAVEHFAEQPPRQPDVVRLGNRKKAGRVVRLRG